MPLVGNPHSNSNRLSRSCPASGLFGKKTSGQKGPLLEGFLSVARNDPARLAVIDGERHVTYADLDRESNRLARFLQDRGVKHGGFVGVAMGRSVELVLSLLAVVKCGGAYLPMDPSYPAGRIARMVETAKPVVVLTRGDFNASESPIDISRPEADWRSLSPDALSGEENSEAPIYCIFTSGSTGEPKGAVVTRRGFTNLVEWYRDEFGFGPGDKTLLVSAPGFDLTQKNIFTPLTSGGTLVVYPEGPFDVPLILRMIGEHKITTINWTPSAFYPLLEGGYSGLRSLRLVVLGGEPILLSKVGPWLESSECGAEIANTYGPTECADICAFYRLSGGNLREFSTVPAGRAISNVQLALMDERLRPAEGVGELVIGGSGVGSGYLGDPGRTAEKFVHNPLPDFFEGPLVYRTGDLMRLLPGGVLDFVGRTDHQVKVRGYRVELGEIESVLLEFPGLREVAVIAGGAGESLGLMGFYSPPSVDQAALTAHLRARVPEYMVPTRFAGLEALPLTPHGKLDRVALARLVPAKPADAAPRNFNATQERIRSIWSEILESADIGLDDGFFDLGGDSIRLARVHAKVMKEFNRMLPITDLFSHPTIRSLAQYLEGGSLRRMSPRERMEKQRQAMASAAGRIP